MNMDAYSAAYRATDPSTSALAAQEISSSGRRAWGCETAIALVKQYPGLTANELEDKVGVQDGRVRKRLNDCYRAGTLFKGAARISRVSGKLSITWWDRPQT